MYVCTIPFHFIPFERGRRKQSTRGRWGPKLRIRNAVNGWNGLVTCLLLHFAELGAENCQQRTITPYRAFSHVKLFSRNGGGGEAQHWDC
jgi:hypothetical protein